MNQDKGDDDGYLLESLKVLEGLGQPKAPAPPGDDHDWVEATLDELFADMEMPAAGSSGPAEASADTETDLEEMQFASLLAGVRFKLLDEADGDDFSEAVMLASGHADARPDQEPSDTDFDDFDDLCRLEPGENNGLWESLKQELGNPAALAAAVFARLREVEPLDGHDQAYDLEAAAMVDDLTLAGDRSSAIGDDFIIGKLAPLLGP